MPPTAAATMGRWRWRFCASGCSGFISRRWKVAFSTAPIRCGSRFWSRCSACIIWRASGSGSELRPHRLRDVLPPAVKIERRLHRRPLEGRYDPVGIDIIAGAARNQHNSAAADHFLEARMMVELVRFGGTGDNDGPAGLHAGQDAGTPRGEAFIERITERVDLAEQAEHLMVGPDVAADDHIVRHAEFGGAGINLLFPFVDTADERPDINDQRFEPALLQDRAYVEQRVGLLVRI